MRPEPVTQRPSPPAPLRRAPRGAAFALAVGCAAAGLAGSAARPAAASDSPPAAVAPEVAQGRRTAHAVEDALVDSMARARAATVSVVIKTFARDGNGVPSGELTLAGCGSGVLVRHKGSVWVLTNQHVVEHADGLTVICADGTEREVEVQDQVEQYDIALLRFAERPKDLQGVVLDKRASRALESGDWVVATGNPFFLAMDGGAVATLGVVSGKDRVLRGEFLYGSAIQHDAAVNPGNSGGPLWTLDGKLVGINGMIMTTQASRFGASNSGASFSIPIEQVESHLDRMCDDRRSAEAGYLGVACETAVDERGQPQGARILQILKESPLHVARKGPGPGSVLLSLAVFNRTHRIETADDLTNALVLYPAGTIVRLQFRERDGKGVATWRGRLTTTPAAPAKK